MESSQHSASGSTAPAGTTTSCTGADFGRVVAGTRRTLRQVIWNSGGSNLSVTNVTLANTDPFSIGFDGCTGVDLPPARGCAVEIDYAPGQPSSSVTQLRISTNDPARPTTVTNLLGSSVGELMFHGSFENACGDDTAA